MRRSCRAVLALLFAGQASAAPVPLSYVAKLTGSAPSLSVASAFLSDAGAQSWLRANRPGDYPALVAGALRLDDWRQTLDVHDNPRQLREAVLARADDPIGASPAALLALADTDPSLSATRKFYEVAALEWSALDRKIQNELVAQGRDELAWGALSLPDRYDAARDAMGALAAQLITAAPGTPEYAWQYESALKSLRPIMTDDELAEQEAELASAKSVAEARARAERAAAAAGGVGAEFLAQARTSGDLDAASARAPAETSSSFTPEESASLSVAMNAAFERELSGIPAGHEVLADLRGGSVRVIVGPTVPGSVASYQPALATITISERHLAAFAAALGRPVRSLLSDSDLRADAALFFAPHLIHEGTHHRQIVWARTLGFGVSVYNQEWEHEAFAAQAEFIRQKRAADPRLSALQERVRRDLPNLAVELDRDAVSDHDSSRLEISRVYRRFPTLSLAAAGVIEAGLASADAQRGALSAIERSLAQAAADRRLRGKTSDDSDVGALRRERDRLAGLAQAAVEAAKRLVDRSRSEMLRLADAR